MPWSDALWLALALFLIMEGVLPFAFPSHWRQWFTQIMQLSDGQIRFFGLLSLSMGLALLLFL